MNYANEIYDHVANLCRQARAAKKEGDRARSATLYAHAERASRNSIAQGIDPLDGR